MAIGQHINYGQPVNRAHPLCRDLVAWWKVLPSWMGGGQWWDLCGRCHGTLTNGPTWGGSLGRPGGLGAIACDGGSVHYALVPASTSNNLASGYSAAIWFKLNSAAVGPFTAIHGNHDGAGAAGWRITAMSGGVWNFSVNLYTNAAAITITDDTNWHHIAGTYDGVTIRIFFDGIEGTSFSFSTATDYTGAAFHVGSRGGGWSNFGGKLDDAQFWSRVLSASEVALLYRETRRPDNPMLNWIRPVRVNSVAAPGGRTTRNTRAFPLGVAIGMDFGHCNI